MLNSESKPKSPLALLLVIAFLIIATLVMISNYFFRPGLELDLRNKIISKLYSHKLVDAAIQVKGRDVVLSGIVTSQDEAEKIDAEIQSISGVHQVESKLIIQNQTAE